MSWKSIENPLFRFEHGDKFAKFHLDFATKPAPTELFHYTSGAALLAILETQCMLATERTYLNDLQEFKFGLTLFSEHLRSLGDASYSADFLDQVMQALGEKLIDNLRHFIVSLSANPDLLSQWRAYGDDGKGFAIGLNGKTLRERSGFGELVLRGIDLEKMPKEYCFCYHLLPVIYDRNEQEEAMVAFLTAAYSSWMRCQERSEPAFQAFFRAIFQYRVKELLISFKNPAFQEESEWRIVTTIHKNSEKICYRDGKFGITPFVKLNLSPRSSLPHKRLDLKCIWIVPSSAAKVNSRGLEMFLESKNIDIALMHSRMGYRS